ncbi:LOG family protein, partial [Candidatus Pacearchaeota archaeon]
MPERVSRKRSKRDSQKKDLDRFEGELAKREFRVAIFGSARIKRNDALYKKIYTLGRMLGERNIDIVTGGGPGLMEAASKGHKAGSAKTNAHTIGLNIKLPREQEFNPYLDFKKEFYTFSARLDSFMQLSNAVVVAHGGVGTLLEFFYTWQLEQVEHICHIPIILFGPMWRGLVSWLKSQPLRRGYFDKKDLANIYHAESCSRVIEIIDKT